MVRLFGWESSFNEDIGAWDTSGVTTMDYMFLVASAFNQDLGWCVDNGVNLEYVFFGTPCAWMSCGVHQLELQPGQYSSADDIS